MQDDSFLNRCFEESIKLRHAQFIMLSVLCTMVMVARSTSKIDQFHVVRYCFLDDAICLCGSYDIAHKYVFVFNNYDRSCTFHSINYS